MGSWPESSPGSSFFPNGTGYPVKDEAREIEGEPVIVKRVNSAFIGTDLDLRLRKDFPNFGGTRLGVTGDLFNVFNRATVLESNATANSEASGKIYGILNPRIVRFGMRLVF